MTNVNRLIVLCFNNCYLTLVSHQTRENFQYKYEDCLDKSIRILINILEVVLIFITLTLLSVDWLRLGIILLDAGSVV